MAYYEKKRETIRCAGCLLFVQVSSAENHCDQCWLYRKTLFSLLTHYKEGKLTELTPPATSTTVFLTTPEKNKRLQHLHSLHRIDQQKITRLQAALNLAIESRGVVVDEDLHQDLMGIVQENEKCVSEMYPPDSFPQLFWENQMRACSVSNARSMRWDPLMI